MSNNPNASTNKKPNDPCGPVTDTQIQKALDQRVEGAKASGNDALKKAIEAASSAFGIATRRARQMGMNLGEFLKGARGLFTRKAKNEATKAVNATGNAAQATNTVANNVTKVIKNSNVSSSQKKNIIKSARMMNSLGDKLKTFRNKYLTRRKNIKGTPNGPAGPVKGPNSIPAIATQTVNTTTKTEQQASRLRKLLNGAKGLTAKARSALKAKLNALTRKLSAAKNSARSSAIKAYVKGKYAVSTAALSFSRKVQNTRRKIGNLWQQQKNAYKRAQEARKLFRQLTSDPAKLRYLDAFATRNQVEIEKALKKIQENENERANIAAQKQKNMNNLNMVRKSENTLRKVKYNRNLLIRPRGKSFSNSANNTLNREMGNVYANLNKSGF